MGMLDGPGRRPNELEERETRRRKKLERQEKRVERLNEPLMGGLCKTLRVGTGGATRIKSGQRGRNSMAAQAENLMQQVLFTALGAWMTFGLIWLIGAVGQMLSLKKAGETDSKAFRSYRSNVIVIVAVAIVLLIAFMAV